MWIKKRRIKRGNLETIDFENKELSVVQNVVNVSGDSGYWNITTPKTKSSRRTVLMPDVLVNDLLKLKEQCHNYYGFNDKWFVFKGKYNSFGTYYNGVFCKK